MPFRLKTLYQRVFSEEFGKSLTFIGLIEPRDSAERRRTASSPKPGNEKSKH